MTDQFEGKNVDEAIDAAAAALGVDRTLINYSVVAEKRGFLGGTRKITIEAQVRDASEGEQPSSPGVAEDLARPPAEARPAGRSRRREAPAPPSAAVEEMPAESAAPLSIHGAQVDRWCRDLFERASLTLRARVTESEETFHVALSGVDAPMLLDKGGELLDSIQVLANKTAFARDSGKKIQLDSSRFREKRELELTEQAHALASKVRGDRSERLLPAMGPGERRIIHLALQDDVDVETESRGEGFFKRVAIIPRKNAPSAPAES